MITGKLRKTKFLLPDPDYNALTRVIKEKGITRDEFYETYAWNGSEWVVCIDNEIDLPQIPDTNRRDIVVTRIDYAGKHIWVHYRDLLTVGKFCLTSPYQQELIDKMGDLKVGNLYSVTLYEWMGYTNLVDVAPKRSV